MLGKILLAALIVLVAAILGLVVHPLLWFIAVLVLLVLLLPDRTHPTSRL